MEPLPFILPCHLSGAGLNLVHYLRLEGAYEDGGASLHLALPHLKGRAQLGAVLEGAYEVGGACLHLALPHLGGQAQLGVLLEGGARSCSCTCLYSPCASVKRKE